MRIRQPISTFQRVVLGTTGFLIAIGCYAYLSSIKHNPNICTDPINKIGCGNPDNKTVPNWTQLKEGWKRCWSVDEFSETGSPQIVDDARASWSRFFEAMWKSILIAIILGMYAGNLSRLNALVLPIAQFTSKFAVTALVAIFFAVVGVGDEMHVYLIMAGILPGMIIALNLALKDIAQELVDKGYTLGATGTQMIWRLMFPMVMPKVFDIMRTATGPAVAWLIAAESISAGDSGFGFGFKIYEMSKALDISTVIWYVLMLAGFVYIVDEGFKLIRRWMCPWYDPVGPGIIKRTTLWIMGHIKEASPSTKGGNA